MNPRPNTRNTSAYRFSCLLDCQELAWLNSARPVLIPGCLTGLPPETTALPALIATREAVPQSGGTVPRGYAAKA